MAKRTAKKPGGKNNKQLAPETAGARLQRIFDEVDKFLFRIKDPITGAARVDRDATLRFLATFQRSLQWFNEGRALAGQQPVPDPIDFYLEFKRRTGE